MFLPSMGGCLLFALAPVVWLGVLSPRPSFLRLPRAQSFLGLARFRLVEDLCVFAPGTSWLPIRAACGSGRFLRAVGSLGALSPSSEGGVQHFLIYFFME